MVAKDAWEVLWALKAANGVEEEGFLETAMSLGQVSAETGAWSEAQASFEWAAEADPTSADPLLKLAGVFKGQREWAKAAPGPSTGLGHGVRPSGGPLCQLALCDFQIREAEQVFEGSGQATEWPDPPLNALFLHGVILEAEGREKEARAAYDLVIEEGFREFPGLATVGQYGPACQE